MAGAQNKRSLPTKVAAMKARKRQRVDGDDAPKKVQPTVPAVPENVRLDDLNWKEVSMPDRLDDMEGFFGLEEIEDVDVVKDGGKVSYRAKHQNVMKANAQAEDADGDDDAAHENSDIEWTGFEDEDGAVTENKSEETTTAEESKPKKEPKKAKDKKKAEKKKANKATKLQDDNNLSFSAIGNLLDDDEKDGVDISQWQSLNLSADTLSCLSKLQFAKPTPIQKAAVPEILLGHDVVGKASTGSGKTLAYGIPILEKFIELQSDKPLAKTDEEKIRTPALALILSPTRELAHQISADMTKLCSGLAGRGPSIATLTGGLSILKQQRLLKTADIVIGTPGRLWEVISGGQGILKWLRQIQFLVIDEADRLLSQGHFKEVEEILNVLDRKERVQGEEQETEDEGPISEGESRQRQTLVFSATFQKDLQQKLAGKQKYSGDVLDKKQSMEYLLKKLNFREEKPKFVDVNPIKQMASGLKEGLVECAGTEKDLYLYALLLLHANARALVFTNSISAVRRLTPFLQNLKMPVLPLHSQMAQKARLRSLERFSATEEEVAAKGPGAKTGSILIATDVAARGLHIPNVNLVIHYHLPRAADTYVHRSGRTARAGEKGSSILICGPEEVAGTRRLIAKVHAKSAAGNTEDLGDAAKNGFFIRSLDIDRRVVAKLKPRATLAKQLADVTIAKEKQHSENDFLREAAEDLGVDIDDDEFTQEAPGKRGRGAGRERKEKESRALSKDEVRGMKYELAEMLKQRVNVGVSERYLTSGGIDVEELLKQSEGTRGEFLGSVRNIGMDD